MDLSTTYLGFRLPHPFLPGASPLVDDLDTVRRLEDAGAAAIVMHSLFEEQIAREQVAVARYLDVPSGSFAEALTFLPSPESFALGPEEYLEHIHKLKATVSIPVIASLNGATDGGWLGYSRLMENAGADALELNVYALATDFDVSSEMIERRTLHMLEAVKNSITIPVAVKLSPFYTSLPSFARRLAERGADGLVLFNRFYQPDIDVEALEVSPTLRLSDSAELLLRLRWLAILSGRVETSLAVTGGVHTSLGRRQSRHGRSRRHPARLHPPAPRPRAVDHPAPRLRPLARRARIRLARADERQHEPGALPQPCRPRAGELHADLAELVGVGGGSKDEGPKGQQGLQGQQGH